MHHAIISWEVPEDIPGKIPTGIYNKIQDVIPGEITERVFEGTVYVWITEGVPWRISEETAWGISRRILGKISEQNMKTIKEKFLKESIEGFL